MGASGWTTVPGGQWRRIYSAPWLWMPSMDVLARETPGLPGTGPAVTVFVDRYTDTPPHYLRYTATLLPGPTVRLVVWPAAWSDVWVSPDRTIDLRLA